MTVFRSRQTLALYTGNARKAIFLVRQTVSEPLAEGENQPVPGTKVLKGAGVLPPGRLNRRISRKNPVLTPILTQGSMISIMDLFLWQRCKSNL